MTGLASIMPVMLEAQRVALARPGVRWAIASTLIVILLLLALGIAFYAYSLGWEHRGNAVAAQQLKTERHLRSELQVQIQRNAALSKAYETEKQKAKTVYRTIRQEVPRVVEKYIERPGSPAADVPAWVVTRGFVRVWNEGLSGAVSASTAGSAGPAATADPVDDQRVGIAAADILGNHVDNAEQYSECRRQLTALIQWHEQQQRE